MPLVFSCSTWDIIGLDAPLAVASTRLRRPIGRRRIVLTMMNIKLIRALLGVGIACLFTVPFISYAAVYQQTVSSHKDTTGLYSYSSGNMCSSDSSVGAQNYLPLGTGLTGVPTSLTMSLSEDAGFAIDNSTRYFRVCIFEMSSNATSSKTGNFVKFYYTLKANQAQSLVTSGIASTTYGGTWSSSTSFDPTKYYGLEIVTSSSQVGRFWGTTSGSYGWQCFSTGFTCDSSTKAPYYSLLTTANYQQQGIVTIVSPVAYSVTNSANNVNFSFTYWVDTSQGFYDTAGFKLTDQTIGQSIDTSSATTSIIASGLSTYSEYWDLVSGHTYLWTPYMKDSAGVNATIYGTPTLFYAVTNNTQSTYVAPLSLPTFTGTWATTSQNSFISTSSSSLFGNTITINSTTTGQVGGLLFSGNSELEGLLKSKFPFSYIFDFKTLLQEVANGNGGGGGNIAYTLPMGKTANGTSTITLLSQTQMATSSPVVQIRTLIQYSLLFMTAIGVVGAAMSAF